MTDADRLFRPQQQGREGPLKSWKDNAPHRTRRDDYATSIAGAEAVAYRAGSQKEQLLESFFAAYNSQPDTGLTDEEAAMRAELSLRSCYWKRCGELRADGLIEYTGRTRTASSGSECNTSTITSAGLKYARDREWS